MFEVALAGGGFAIGSFGAGGFLGVSPVGSQLFFGSRHNLSFSFCIIPT